MPTTLPTGNALLMRFQPDSASRVSRNTVKLLALRLGLKGDADVLHYAVKKLAKEVLPAYEKDDGLLTRKQLAAIKKAVPQGRVRRVSSSLFD